MCSIIGVCFGGAWLPVLCAMEHLVDTLLDHTPGFCCAAMTLVVKASFGMLRLARRVRLHNDAADTRFKTFPNRSSVPRQGMQAGLGAFMWDGIRQVQVGSMDGA